LRDWKRLVSFIKPISKEIEMNVMTRSSSVPTWKNKTTGIFVAAVWLALLSVASGNALASSAWWMMCDWCVTDSDFSNRALSAPGTYETVYVTNRDVNETRKYNRTFVIDDLWDGVQQTVFVGEIDLPADEQAVFAQAVEDATILTETIPRNELAGLIPGVGEQGSLVHDISQGYIPTHIRSAVREAIRQRNLLPDHTSVSAEAGVNIVGTGGNVGAGTTIRVQDVTVVIEYEDGSAFFVTRRASDGKFVDWGAVDADGNPIGLQESDSGDVPINPGSFVDRSFAFDGPGSGVAAGTLAELLDSRSMQCSTWTTTSGAGITCSRR